MRRDTDKTRKTSRGRYCNNATDFMSIVYLVGVILLALHLFVLQIVDIHKYREKGRMQRASHDFAVRGDIYDRHGIKLATDRIYYNIYARPVDYSDKETPKKIAKLFAPIL